MARPQGFEPPSFWFVAVRATFSNLADCVFTTARSNSTCRRWPLQLPLDGMLILAGTRHIGELAEGTKGTELGPLQVPIVPMSVKAPVAASMLYIETSFEPEFVT